MEDEIKINCFADISSALVWIHHSTFNPIIDKAHEMVARSIARDMTDFKSSFRSQHIKGDHNDVADSLSRYFHLSTQQITHLLYKLLPTHNPNN